MENIKYGGVYCLELQRGQVFLGVKNIKNNKKINKWYVDSEINTK